MDRPGLDDEIKFAGGIFSGSVLEVIGWRVFL